jgi:MFS family permease
VSERTSAEGNADAPRVEENEVRSGDGHLESGTRRVGEARQDQETDRQRRENELGTSWTSIVFGWLAALGAGLILSGIVAAGVGAIVALLGLGASSGGISSILGAVTLLLAFLIGGYVAGRMASRSGAKHGLLVALLALIVAILFVIVGGILGATFADALGNAVPPGLTQSIPTSVPQGLGTAAIVGGILALLTPFIGGALCGAWGAKTGRNSP